MPSRELNQGLWDAGPAAYVLARKYTELREQTRYDQFCDQLECERCIVNMDVYSDCQRIGVNDSLMLCELAGCPSALLRESTQI